MTAKGGKLRRTRHVFAVCDSIRIYLTLDWHLSDTHTLFCFIFTLPQTFPSGILVFINLGFFFSFAADFTEEERKRSSHKNLAKSNLKSPQHARKVPAICLFGNNNFCIYNKHARFFACSAESSSFSCLMQKECARSGRRK
jgi:hypothetical protein